MDTLSALATGFAVALTPYNLFWATLGVTVGTAVGVLPGIGPGSDRGASAARHDRA